MCYCLKGIYLTIQIELFGTNKKKQLPVFLGNVNILINYLKADLVQRLNIHDTIHRNSFILGSLRFEKRQRKN